MSFSVRRAAAGLTAGLLATTVLTGTPAYANTPANCYHNPSKELANSRLSAAIYCTDGEWLGVHDDQADGYSARAAIQLYQSQVGFWYDAHECFDDTTVADYQGWSFCNFSVPDGTLVRIRLWSSRNGVESYPVVTGSFTT
ncbi:hypothetical protein ACFVWG_27705 [Kribbella sp. NPDC058245]|uniref:hypothetical protein n=1 Tax=Kribbella sp. NPDC058245 TaxID=3346399 RepID=UPI0036ED01AA